MSDVNGGGNRHLPGRFIPQGTRNALVYPIMQLTLVWECHVAWS